MYAKKNNKYTANVGLEFRRPVPKICHLLWSVGAHSYPFKTNQKLLLEIPVAASQVQVKVSDVNVEAKEKVGHANDIHDLGIFFFSFIEFFTEESITL